MSFAELVYVGDVRFQHYKGIRGPMLLVEIAGLSSRLDVAQARRLVEALSEWLRLVRP